MVKTLGAILQVPIGQVRPYPGNPRKSSLAIDKVAASLSKFGWKQPLVVDKDFVIAVGHTRLEAAKKLGCREVPCVIADDLSPEELKAYRLADNKTAEFSVWDNDLLKVELDDLAGKINMEPFGFMNNDFFDVVEDDYDMGQKVPPVATTGDIWQLGKHRVMCGDCLEGPAVAALMRGGAADLVLTDPPYNCDYVGKTPEHLKIQNDRMNEGQYRQFLTTAFINMHEHSKQGAPVYVFHADSEGLIVRSAFNEAGYSLRQCLVWIKNSMVMGRQDYQWKHEPILYGWKEGAGHAWYSDRKQTTVLEYDRPTRSAEHPTMKPVMLCGYLIENSSKAGDLILDLFGGSGSTLIAAEQLQRSCYMMEIDPHYADVIIHRWETYTGSKAVKEAA